jgi:hypothetical protein
MQGSLEKWKGEGKKGRNNSERVTKQKIRTLITHTHVSKLDTSLEKSTAQTGSKNQAQKPLK